MDEEDNKIVLRHSAAVLIAFELHNWLSLIRLGFGYLVVSLPRSTKRREAVNKSIFFNLKRVAKDDPSVILLYCSMQGDEFPPTGRVARVVPSVINPIAKIAGSTPAPPTMAEAII